MKFAKKDIKDYDEFERIGYHYSKIWADDSAHIYVFKMEKEDEDSMVCYPEIEVVMGKRYVNPDGSVVFYYPSDEDFGTYGFFIQGREAYCREQALRRINEFRSKRELLPLSSIEIDLN